MTRKPQLSAFLTFMPPLTFLGSWGQECQNPSPVTCQSPTQADPSQACSRRTDHLEFDMFCTCVPRTSLCPFPAPPRRRICCCTTRDFSFCAVTQCGSCVWRGQSERTAQHPRTTSPFPGQYKPVSICPRTKRDPNSLWLEGNHAQGHQSPATKTEWCSLTIGCGPSVSTQRRRCS